MTALKHGLRSAYCLLTALLFVGACVAFDPIQKPGGTLIVENVSRSQQAIVPPQGTYRLQVGDTISVFVFDNPDLSRDVVVAPDGRVSYPLAGSFRAEGRTLNETGSILASRFSDNIVAPQVSVSLASLGAYTVYVNGEVLQPGALTLQQPITLVQALTMAGGFTAFAKRDRIIIYNPNKADAARRIFDYNRFVTDPRQKDILLQSGDTIIVL